LQYTALLNLACSVIKMNKNTKTILVNASDTVSELWVANM